MIKKYEFAHGGKVYMLDLWLFRVGFKDKKVYMFQFRGFNAVSLRKL